MPQITFIMRNGIEKRVEASSGTTLMRIAQDNGVEIEGACEGSMACSTCHVVFDENWFSRLSPPSEEEEDMLDLTVGLTAFSRLGCQIVISDELDGIVVALPRETVNISDY